MDRLIAELQRLYFLPEQDGATPTFDLVGPEGTARAMVIGFERASDWERVAELCRGVQEDLDLPAPAVSVSGEDGYRVWFSLAAPVPAEQARFFMDALRARYLAEIPAARLDLRPDANRNSVDQVPALRTATGKWSAYIDPDMGSMFVDGAWLEMAPNPDKQADLLAGFECIKAADFQRALAILRAPADAPPSLPPPDPVGSRATLNVGGNFSDPRSFLLAVMNDPSASAEHRLRAAEALLPYFGKPDSK